MEEQAVEIDRHQSGGVDGCERLAIGEPARAEVPSAFGGSTEIAVDFRRRPVRRASRFDILPIGLLAWAVAVIPIAVQERAIVQPHDTAMRLAGLKRVGALHPEGILFAQSRQERGIGRGRIAASGHDEFHHGCEEWRLRTAQEVAPVAIGNMPVSVDEADKVLDHADRKIMTAAFLKPQHGEIGIPIVDLVEASTRHDVRPWQRQERGVRTERRAVGPAFEDLPQIVDVAAHVLAGIAAIGAALGRRHGEVSVNECG